MVIETTRIVRGESSAAKQPVVDRRSSAWAAHPARVAARLAREQPPLPADRGARARRRRACARPARPIRRARRRAHRPLARTRLAPSASPPAGVGRDTLEPCGRRERPPTSSIGSVRRGSRSAARLRGEGGGAASPACPAAPRGLTCDGGAQARGQPQGRRGLRASSRFALDRCVSPAAGFPLRCAPGRERSTFPPLHASWAHALRRAGRGRSPSPVGNRPLSARPRWRRGRPRSPGGSPPPPPTARRRAASG